MAHPAIKCPSQYTSSPSMPLRPSHSSARFIVMEVQARHVPSLSWTRCSYNSSTTSRPHMTLACTNYRQPHGQRQESLSITPPPGFPSTQHNPNRRPKSATAQCYHSDTHLCDGSLDGFGGKIVDGLARERAGATFRSDSRDEGRDGSHKLAQRLAKLVREDANGLHVTPQHVSAMRLLDIKR